MLEQKANSSSNRRIADSVWDVVKILINITILVMVLVNNQKFDDLMLAIRDLRDSDGNMREEIGRLDARLEAEISARQEMDSMINLKAETAMAGSIQATTILKQRGILED